MLKPDWVCYKTYKWDKDAFRIFRSLKNKENLFFLDSSLNLEGQGRFSFIGFEPAFLLKSHDKENPFGALRKDLDRFAIPKDLSELSPFLCGFCGYLSYDLGFTLQKIRRNSFDDLILPTSYLGFYDAVITVDHFKKTLTVFSSGLPETRPRLINLKAKHRFRRISRLLSGMDEDEIVIPEIKTGSLASNFTPTDYIRAIDKTKEYIREGDIYQINLSRRFKVSCSGDGFSLYQRLREFFPSAFSAYFDCGNFKILSSSPERFLRLEKDKVITRPMKGTRPRGKTEAKDRLFKEELLNSVKDKAELLMIVDLERNDLGRVCEYGSVKVTRPRVLETYSTVFQTTSQIEGRLHKDKDRIDLIKACFPGGSITGCPKIRAMEIIEELEHNRRNIYTGSLGYLDLAGNMDFNILIRTLVLKQGQIYFQTGGGIVADSQARDEYNETLVKAEAIIKTLGITSLLSTYRCLSAPRTKANNENILRRQMARAG